MELQTTNSDMETINYGSTMGQLWVNDSLIDIFVNF